MEFDEDHLEAASAASDASGFVHVDMEVEKMEKETGITGDYAFMEMMTQVYQKMWQGSKDKTIKAMLLHADGKEMEAIMEFAKTVPEDALESTS